MDKDANAFVRTDGSTTARPNVDHPWTENSKTEDRLFLTAEDFQELFSGVTRMVNRRVTEEHFWKLFQNVLYENETRGNEVVSSRDFGSVKE